MDDKDWAILRELQRDARQSTTSIAERTGIPRPTVHDRIQRLETAGVIEGYTVLVNPEKVGRGLTAYIFASYIPTEEQNQRELARKMSRIPQVEEVHILTGQWDFLLKVQCASMDEVGTLILNKLRTLPGVGNTVTSVSFWSFRRTGEAGSGREVGVP
ncbi:MAG TPA: Lrp/AsnC family transcriptional regulator [Candidatus Thermoplasmatota archaeon]|nr:Lrp/AsnC family transcriptional regulator [Candidatus Thermoplasmatota archaeon]